jgi:hypothetical protein
VDGTTNGSCCTSCGIQFSVFKWKHICDACGHPYCASCLEKSLILRPDDLILLATSDVIDDWNRLHRCCNPCFERISNRPVKSSEDSSIQLPHPMDYTLDKLLGEGFYSKVYSAISNLTKEEFAIKVFDKNK